LGAANRISNDAQLSRRPTVVAKGSGALLVWEDYGGTAGELAVATLDSTGGLVGIVGALTSDDGVASQRPHLATDGTVFAAAYFDAAVGDGQVLVQRLDSSGAPVGSPTQASSCLGGRPRIVWTGDRWTVVYFGCGGLHRAAVDAAGTVVDAERAIFREPGVSRLPALAWDGGQAVAAFGAGLFGDDEVVLTSLACATDDTPPVCPSGLSASAVGNSLDLRWGPGFDADFALRWNYVYRDDRRIVALPAGALGYDDPLPPPGPHTYRVSAVNQGLIESPGCSEVTLSLTLFYDGFESGDTSAWSP